MKGNPKKTICTYFERNGQCRYGDRCRFQHPTSHNSATAFSERSWSESEVVCPHRAIYTSVAFICTACIRPKDATILDSVNGLCRPAQCTC